MTIIPLRFESKLDEGFYCSWSFDVNGFCRYQDLPQYLRAFDEDHFDECLDPIDSKTAKASYTTATITSNLCGPSENGMGVMVAAASGASQTESNP